MGTPSAYANVVGGGLRFKSTAKAAQPTLTLGRTKRSSKRRSSTSVAPSTTENDPDLPPIKEPRTETDVSARSQASSALREPETAAPSSDKCDTCAGARHQLEDALQAASDSPGSNNDAPSATDAHPDKEERVTACPPFDERLLDEVVRPEEKLTVAEKAFRLAQKKREAQRTNKRLALTHRQRMERFNAHLMQLPEHFDIPKVGPG